MLLQKKLRILIILLLTLSLLSTFNACDKDDDPVEPEKKETPNKPKEEKTEQSDDEGSLSLYSVNGYDINKITDYKISDNLLDLQKDSKKHTEIWDLISKVIPNNYITFFNEYLIMTGNESGVAGFVVQTKEDLTKWKIGIAIDLAYEGGFNKDGELSYTIIHEFAHVLTLNNTQLNSRKTENDCQNFFPGEGCANGGSYINALYQNFWKDIHDEFLDTGDDESKKQAFYEKYQDRFVTQYASTNPGEDIAECFTHFVIFDKPTGNTYANKKVQLFYNYPELVELRKHIRKSLSIGTKSKSTSVIKVWRRGATFGKKDQKRS